MGYRTRHQRKAWVSLCAEVLRKADSSLSEADAYELANALWDRPSVRGFDPDMVAQLILTNRSLWGRPGH
jgi:hypothetical protein